MCRFNNIHKKIYIYKLDIELTAIEPTFNYSKVKEVYLDETISGELTEDFFESFYNESFNYEFSWFPKSSSFIFTSNAGLGEYNLFIGSVEEDDVVLATLKDNLEPKEFGDYFMMTEEIKKDGQAKVSPEGKRIVEGSTPHLCIKEILRIMAFLPASSGSKARDIFLVYLIMIDI